MSFVGNDISPNEHPRNAAKDVPRNSSRHSMKSQTHKTIHHEDKAAIYDSCFDSHDGHRHLLVDAISTSYIPRRNGTKNAEKSHHVNTSKRCCSEQTITISNDEYTHAVARSRRKTSSEPSVPTSLGDCEKHARHSKTDDCAKHVKRSKLDDCQKHVRHSKTDECAKHVRHSKLDECEKHVRHSKLDDCEKHVRHSKLDDCEKHVRHCKLDDCTKHFRHSKHDDNAKHARHHKRDIITGKYIDNTNSADCVDICTGKDNDWQRIWLHIKPFGRRMPHGLTDGSRQGEHANANDDSCIPDKYHVDKIVCAHCTSDDRVSSTSRAQVGITGSGNDLTKRRGSLQHSPRMHSGLRSRKERNTSQNNNCVNRKQPRGNRERHRKDSIVNSKNITLLESSHAVGYCSDNRSSDNTNNNNNRRRYYTSDETDTDSDCLMTNYAGYDSIGPSAAVHQRCPTNQHQQIRHNDQVQVHSRDHYSNYCVDRYYHARASTDDDYFYSSRGNAKQTTPLINRSDNHNVYIGDEDARQYKGPRVSVDERRTAGRFVRAILQRRYV